MDDIVKWIVENVDETAVPQDEGNADGLVYNLVQLALHGKGYEPYAYKPAQDDFLKKLYDEHGRVG